MLLKGSGEGDSLGFLGYCPQENALWPNLTVKEHLEVFAAVMGLSKSHAAVTITRYVGGGAPRTGGDQGESEVTTFKEKLGRKAQEAG